MQTFVTPTLLAKLAPAPALRFPTPAELLALRPLPNISLASASFFLRRRSWDFLSNSGLVPAQLRGPTSLNNFIKRRYIFAGSHVAGGVDQTLVRS